MVVQLSMHYLDEQKVSDLNASALYGDEYSLTRKMNIHKHGSGYRLYPDKLYGADGGGRKPQGRPVRYYCAKTRHLMSNC